MLKALMRPPVIPTQQHKPINGKNLGDELATSEKIVSSTLVQLNRSLRVQNHSGQNMTAHLRRQPSCPSWSAHHSPAGTTRTNLRPAASPPPGQAPGSWPHSAAPGSTSTLDQTSHA